MTTVLRDAIFWIAVVSCAVAQFYIVRAVLRTASEPVSPGVPAPRRLAEVAWAIIPALLMVAVFVGAWRLMHPIAP